MLHASSSAKHSGKFDNSGKATLDIFACVLAAGKFAMTRIFITTSLVTLAVVALNLQAPCIFIMPQAKQPAQLQNELLGQHTPATATSPGPQDTTVTDMLVLSSSFMAMTSNVNRYVPGGFCRLMSSNASPVTGSDELRANGRPSNTACAQQQRYVNVLGCRL